MLAEKKEVFMAGRQKPRRSVAIALEIHEPKGFGRVRMQHIPNVSGNSLNAFVCSAVQPGSVVHTDGWSGYNDLASHGYQQQRVVLSATGDPAHVALPGVHRVASLVKRWLLGTHQGAIRRAHLDGYLDEFTFRFNRRTSRSRGLLFYRLVETAVITDPTPYEAIVRDRATSATFVDQ